jgi:hypothetical protein
MYEFNDRLESLLNGDVDSQAETPDVISYTRMHDEPEWEEVRMCAKCVGECKIY